MQVRVTTPRRPSLLSFLLPLLAVAGACVSPQGERPVESTGFLPASGLDQVNPADIAVEPVRVALLDGGQAPADGIREALYLGLINRLYSPLPLSWVDGGGDFDAVLRVRVLEWDRSMLKYDGTILARAEARLVADGKSLWAVELTRRLNRNISGTQRDDATKAEASAARHLATEILALLPSRNALRE